MDIQRTSLIDYSNFGNKDIQFETESLIPDENKASHYCSKKVRVIATLLGLGGLGVSSYFAITEQMKDDPTRSKKIYTVCMFSQGSSVAIFYHTVCPDSWRSIIDRMMNASAFVLGVFAPAQVYRSLHTKREQEIMHGYFVFAHGFFQTRDLLMQLSLKRTDFDQTADCPESIDDLYPMPCPNMRDLTGAGIMLAWEGISSAVLVGFFLSIRHSYNDDLNDIGLYGNMAGAYFGTFVGGLGAFCLDHWKDKQEKFFKESRNASSYVIQGMRHAKTLFFQLSNTIQGSLFQVLKSISYNLPTRQATRMAANSGAAVFIAIIAGAVFGSRNVFTKKDNENPLSFLNSIKKIEKEKEPSKFQCKADLKTAKTVWKTVRTALPFLALIGMMTFFGVVAGKTHSEEILGTAILIELTLVFSFFTTYFLADSPYETNPNPSPEGILEGIKEWKIKLANGARYLIQTPEIFASLYTYLTIKFQIDDRHLKHDHGELLFLDKETWIALMIALGQDLALNAKRKKYMSYGLPAIAMIEYAKSTASGFRS